MIERPIKFMSADGNTTWTINDRGSSFSEGTRGFTSTGYFIDVRSVDGLWAADISYESHPIPGAIGEKSGDVYRRGKTVTLTGEIIAAGMAQLRNAERYLHQMFYDTAIRKLKFQLWNDGFEIFLNCRVNQDLVITESKDGSTPGGFHRCSWTIALRADNPRTYKVSDSTLYPSYQ